MKKKSTVNKQKKNITKPAKKNLQTSKTRKTNFEKLSPLQFANSHARIMDDIVPAVSKGADARYIYSYIVKFGLVHKLTDTKNAKSFLRGCLDVYHKALSPDFFDSLEVSDAVKTYCKKFIGTARKSTQRNIVKQLENIYKNQKKPAGKNELEKIIIKLVGPLAISSAKSAQKYISPGNGKSSDQKSKDSGGSVDGGEIVEADVKGMIAGGVAGFVGGLLAGGIASPGAAAGGAAAGAATTSAIKYFEEDAVRDATGPAVTQASGGDGDQGVWDGDGNNDGWGDWSDGDGYGLG